MSNAQNYLSFAELALASHAESLLVGRPDSDKLRKAGFSTPQANAFADAYTVLDQYNDDTTGLSATVFQHAATGAFTLAICGTDGPEDLLTNLIDVALLGAHALQAQYAALQTQVQAWIQDGTLPGAFTVTGHSLG
jgi:hypothetical protein